MVSSRPSSNLQMPQPLSADQESESLHTWRPSSAEEKALVRGQLTRILGSPLFSNSRRFPAFLRFTVEHALSSSETLKERTIGHEAFGREPGYDTSQDPIVRMAAAEVRKRLVQYYQADRAGEVVISYQPGSYVPEFAPPSRSLAGGSVGAGATGASVPPGRTTSILWIATALVAAGAFAALAMWPRSNIAAENALVRFWQPILGESGAVLLCIGDPYSNGQQLSGTPGETPAGDLTLQDFLQTNSVRFTDSVTLALIAGELRAKSKPFRIRRPASTDLKDLREGPVILIGGFNNPWTLRLSEGLRFTLAGDEDGNYILDRTRPDSRQWRTGRRTTRLKDLSETYGLITRMKDPATGGWVMILSGLLLGTRAAAECVLDETCLAGAEPPASVWGQRNAQIVVKAAVVGEDSGAPTVLATHVW